MTGSTVGIKATWRCAACVHFEEVYQFASVANILIDLPRGWMVRDGASYCPRHVPDWIAAD